tara:strand:+ start:42 stop:536 length:495 start_codon:yes stop_codon:yes gene_type:complete
MNKKTKKYVPFMQWIIQIAEEKIIEHKILKKQFDSNEEFIIFTIIWLRVYENMFKEIKYDLSDLSFDEYINNFLNNQKNQYLGMTINAITRESEIPRSTVKRIVEKLISKKIASRNSNRLIIPTINVRKFMEVYRNYIYKTNRKHYQLFKNLNLENEYNENEIF